ncbi:MAG: PfkB family carbohydrate kinase, partial [Flavitalea sp.]
MKALIPVDNSGYLYDHIIGTGGIGSGIFFSLEDDHTLGRNESRMATLLPYKDYCKQHIIMHYIAVLLGAGKGFRSYPIGKVGADEIGDTLIGQMKSAGMDTRYISIAEGFRTLFSVCFQYPDLSGGNITTDNGASSQVTDQDINAFFSTSDPGAGKEIILSAPEVPLPARITLLKQGRVRGARNIAAIQSSEIDSFLQAGGFGLTDFLSVNIDEAKSLAALQQESTTPLIVD